MFSALKLQKVARYVGDGRIEIVPEETPGLPEGGLLVETEACGLCSGELMGWYMDRKVPHVLGHEVAGRVIESDDDRFPVGRRVFPHHHAPCLRCERCRAGLYVHCDQWKRTKLTPGGMAEVFAVPSGNLNDTLDLEGVRSIDGALIEPLGCVVKSVRSVDSGLLFGQCDSRTAVVGLGVMGLMHMLVLGSATGFDLNPSRVEWASALGLRALEPRTDAEFDTVFVCPGSQTAFDFALALAAPGAHIVMFAPTPPGQSLQVPQDAYFRDLRITHAYSCGPTDTIDAKRLIEDGRVKAEQVVSHFIAMDELPQAYQAMKAGEILKPMVVFGS